MIEERWQRRIPSNAKVMFFVKKSVYLLILLAFFVTQLFDVIGQIHSKLFLDKVNQRFLLLFYQILTGFNHRDVDMVQIS